VLRLTAETVAVETEQTSAHSLYLPSAERRALILLVFLLGLTFAKGALWAVLIAPLDAPDEPSHLNYIVQVREGHLLPVVDLVSPGGLRTPPSTPLNQDVRNYFAAYDYKFFRSMPYESAQPPLYYWAAAAWTRPVGIAPHTIPTFLLAARLFSVLLGTLAVFALWLALRWSVPRIAWIQWAGPLALTLSPEFTFTTATVSNDAGMVFWGAVLLAVWALGLGLAGRSGRVHARARLALVTLCAIVTAAGVLTKLTFIASVPVSLVWIFWVSVGSRREGGRAPRVRDWALSTAGFLALAGALVLPWVLRNLRVYGEPTGARAIFDLIHRIYWDRYNFPPDQLFTEFPPLDFVLRSFRSFWALFGWATVWLDDWVYIVLAGFAALSVVGLVYGMRRFLRSNREGAGWAFARLLMLAALLALLAFANYLGYNSLVEFQPHMRYTFVSLVAVMLLLISGLALGPWRERWARWVVGALLLWLALAHLLSLGAVWSHTQIVMASVGN
jgi:hypothetical protein